MVRIVDPTPHPKVEKRLPCSECGAQLAYVPRDVKTYETSCMGETTTVWYVDCPACSGNARIRSD